MLLVMESCYFGKLFSSSLCTCHSGMSLIWSVPQSLVHLFFGCEAAEIFSFRDVAWTL